MKCGSRLTTQPTLLRQGLAIRRHHLVAFAMLGELRGPRREGRDETRTAALWSNGQTLGPATAASVLIGRWALAAATSVGASMLSTHPSAAALAPSSRARCHVKQVAGLYRRLGEMRLAAAGMSLGGGGARRKSNVRRR